MPQGGGAWHPEVGLAAWLVAGRSARVGCWMMAGGHTHVERCRGLECHLIAKTLLVLAEAPDTPLLNRAALLHRRWMGRFLRPEPATDAVLRAGYDAQGRDVRRRVAVQVRLALPGWPAGCE